MKTIVLVLSLFVLLNSNAQCKFTVSGKAVEKLTYKDKNIKVNVNVPSIISGYGAIGFNLYLKDKNEKDIRILDKFAGYVSYNPSDLKDVKSLTFLVCNENGESDFKTYSGKSVNIHGSSNLKLRTSSDYEIILEVYGRTFSRYDYENGKATPVYDYTTLKLYKIDYFPGEVKSNYTSKLGYFNVVKLNNCQVRIYGEKPGEVSNPFATETQSNGFDQISIVYQPKVESETILFDIFNYSKKEKSTDDLKQEFENKITNMTNAEFNYSSYAFNVYNFKEQLYYLPVSKNKKKSKKEPYVWKDTTMSNIKMSALVLDVYTSWEYHFRSGLKSGKENHSRKFYAFVFETENRVYSMYAYKYGENYLVSTNGQAFINKTFNGLKILKG